jgi:hypothetical protein
MNVPKSVDFAMVFSGSLMLSAGIVAVSIPKNANKVKVETAEKASKSVASELLKAGKLSRSK